MANEAITRITCEELKQRLDDNERPIIIDTRHRSSYGRGHLPGAVNIPYDAAGDPMEREMMLASLPGDRLVVIYCD
jgi:rhodanese-related sulfurtransferase